MIGQTRVEQNTTSPTYNEPFELPLPPPPPRPPVRPGFPEHKKWPKEAAAVACVGANREYFLYDEPELVLDMYDHDDFGADDFLGRAVIKG